MNYLYYCNSNYQLLNALNLNWHRKNASFENIKDYKADLIILDTFKSAKEVSERIRKGNEFDNVYLINKTDATNKLGKINLLFGLICPSNLIKRSGIKDYKNFKNRYDVITVPKFSMITGAIWQLNRNAKINIYEDGLVTYSSNDLFELGSKNYNKVYKLFNGRKTFNDCECMYFNNTNLYSANKKIELRNNPIGDDEYYNHIKGYFAEKPLESYKDEKLFWLYQFNFGNGGIYKEVVNITKEYLLDYKDKVVFCPHPRIQDFDGSDFLNAETKSPWEIKGLYIDNMDDKCILTCCSSGAFNSKILFNKEPYIIFTYKLLGESNKQFVEEVDSFVDKFKTIYPKEKLMLPENYQELKECIDKFMNK